MTPTIFGDYDFVDRNCNEYRTGLHAIMPPGDWVSELSSGAVTARSVATSTLYQDWGHSRINLPIDALSSTFRYIPVRVT
jgi:hypothetical protein